MKHISPFIRVAIKLTSLRHSRKEIKFKTPDFYDADKLTENEINKYHYA